MNLAAYKKTVTALATGVIGWGLVVVTSAAAAITSGEWMMLAVAVATGLGVYAVRNEPLDEGGESQIALVCLIVLAAIALLWACGVLPAH